MEGIVDDGGRLRAGVDASVPHVVHVTDARRWRAVLVGAGLALVGCRDRATPTVDLPAPIREPLARSRDPVELSEAIRAATRAGCASTARAVRALDARITGPTALPAVVLEGLLEDARLAASSCGDPGWRHELARIGGVAATMALAPEPGDDAGLASALDALAPLPAVPVVLYRRARLEHRRGHTAAAIRALEHALADDEQPAARAQLALLVPDPERGLAVLDAGRTPTATHAAGTDDPVATARAILLVRAGRLGDAARAVVAAPPVHRRALAVRVVEAGGVEALERWHELSEAGVELLAAAGDRLQQLGKPGRASDCLARAAALAPDDADLAIALAEASTAAGEVERAIAAWDRAASLQPALERAALAPIELLAGARRPADARARARALADGARRAQDADQLARAAMAAALADDPRAALALIREARALRPTDGRLQALAADRLAAVDARAALAAYVELLVCGAHGRPWHRHELVARIVETATARDLTGEARALIAAPSSCAPVGPGELASYLDEVRLGLDRRPPDRP